MDQNKQWDEHWRYSNLTIALGSAVMLVTGMLPDCRDDAITSGDFIACAAFAIPVATFVWSYLNSRNYDNWRESYTGREEDGFLKTDWSDTLKEYVDE